MTPNYPACYLLVRKDNQFLFVMRENTGYMDGQYSLPAGRVEENENFSHGAAREAFEEVGIAVNPTQIRHVLTQHRKTTGQFSYWVDVFFEAAEWQGEPVNNAPLEHSKIEWLPIDNMPSNVMDYQKYALEQIAKGKTYCEFGW